MLLMLLCPSSALTQVLPTARVVKQFENGWYRIVINSDTLIAMPRVDAERFAQQTNDLQTVTGERDAARQIISQYRATIASADTAVRRWRDYAQAMDQQIARYQELVKLLEKRSKAPRVSFDAGIGIAGTDKQIAAMGGLGFRRVRIWGIAQDGGPGVLVGANLPIF